MHAVRPTRTRVVGAVATLALASVLTACGSDGSSAADDTEPVAGASSSTTDESTATDEPTEEPSVIDDGAQIDVAQFVSRLQAGIDNTENAHIEYTMDGVGGEMKGSGDVDYTVKPPNMQMSMEIGPESVGMLLVDGTMYIQSSQAGDKYIAYDLSDPNNPLGAGMADQLDPAASMKNFTKAVSSVTSSGKEKIDGQSLEQFTLTIDTTQLADQSQSAGLPAEMQIQVWLDEQDRMAKTTMDMGAITYDASLTDFDKPVDLEAPPANQIAKPPAA